MAEAQHPYIVNLVSYQVLSTTLPDLATKQKVGLRKPAGTLCAYFVDVFMMACMRRTRLQRLQKTTTHKKHRWGSTDERRQKKDSAKILCWALLLNIRDAQIGESVGSNDDTRHVLAKVDTT